MPYLTLKNNVEQYHILNLITHNRHMKKLIGLCLLCVIFFSITLSITPTYALQNERLEFLYNDKVFIYSLNKNIRSSSVFDVNYKLNKYNRFGSTKDRQKLLTHLLNQNFDNEIIAEYMFPNLSKTILKMQKIIEIEPKNAKININSNTEQVFFIKKEIIGTKILTDELYENIFNSYLKNDTLSFVVPTENLVPKIRASEFKYTNLRSDFSTDISRSTVDRKHNIKNALNSLNKVEIYPNQTFSFNQTIGKRTEQNGYRNAKIIVNNEFVDGIGGGVCQVSSTLYNSALLAGLEIVEANKHSKQVSYVKYGFDAMVNYGSSDLKFKNNTNEKLTIITNYSSSNARIRIFGESLNNSKYKLSNEIVSTTEPIEEIIFDTNNEYSDKVLYEDESFYLKTPSKGMEIKTYREHYENSTLKKRELLRHDKFKVQNAIKVFGTKKRAEISAQDSFLETI